MEDENNDREGGDNNGDDSVTSNNERKVDDFWLNIEKSMESFYSSEKSKAQETCKEKFSKLEELKVRNKDFDLIYKKDYELKKNAHQKKLTEN